MTGAVCRAGAPIADQHRDEMREKQNSTFLFPTARPCGKVRNVENSELHRFSCFASRSGHQAVVQVRKRSANCSAIRPEHARTAVSAQPLRQSEVPLLRRLRLRGDEARLMHALSSGLRCNGGPMSKNNLTEAGATERANKERKAARRTVKLKSSAWYQAAVRSIGITKESLRRVAMTTWNIRPRLPLRVISGLLATD